jgi:predicted dehydrogenase/threonine dehydrogenase-like Zn-dependent dehydrogenase
MKQIIQSLTNGAIEVADVPRPSAGLGQLLIRTRATLVSAGTERMLLEFGKSNWIQRARQQPDKVRMVLDKVANDGLFATVSAVKKKLEQPLPLGYCNVGEIVQVGPGVNGFAVGDRVASNGRHAEFVAVAANLCARVNDEVSDEAAAFTVLGSIALQGVRLVKPTLGECVAVTGLGLVGLVTAQLLRANGCRVIGFDIDAEKLRVARQLGFETVDVSAGEDPVAAAQRFSRGRGMDAVLITASTHSNEPVRQAAIMSRKRGRIVLVGVAGLELSRAAFFEKELSFQVSCSYGPGRYDPDYEEKGRDYPVGYVRWTVQRNFEAVLDMMADSRLDLAPLISHKFEIADAERAYQLIASNAPSLGVLIQYPKESHAETNCQHSPQTLRIARTSRIGPVTVGFVGAGNYASGTLIPAFRETRARLKTVSSATGVSGMHAARKHEIEFCSTDSAEMLADADIDAVVVSTRHSTHAQWVRDAIAAGKHVFVEKPLAMTLGELDAIGEAYRDRASITAPPILMVGFNRRFAPHVKRVRLLLQGVTGPHSFVMTINAGAIPNAHWTQDPEVGGGRIIGEACHFIDLLRFLADSPIASYRVMAMQAGPSAAKIPDTVTIALEFATGSIGTIHYFANGHTALPKERLEVFSQGRVLQLDNFRKLKGFGWPNFRRMNLWRMDKGNRACAAAFVDAIANGGESPIPFNELMEVSRVTVEASEALAR